MNDKFEEKLCEIYNKHKGVCVGSSQPFLFLSNQFFNTVSMNVE